MKEHPDNPWLADMRLYESKRAEARQYSDQQLLMKSVARMWQRLLIEFGSRIAETDHRQTWWSMCRPFGF